MLLLYHLSCYFFKKIVWTHVLYENTDAPVLDFWWHFWVSKPEWSWIQSQSGQAYLHLAKVYMMYLPWDSPLVWHLPTSWWPAWRPVAFPNMRVLSDWTSSIPWQSYRVIATKYEKPILVFFQVRNIFMCPTRLLYIFDRVSPQIDHSGSTASTVLEQNKCKKKVPSNQVWTWDLRTLAALLL